MYDEMWAGQECGWEVYQGMCAAGRMSMGNVSRVKSLREFDDERGLGTRLVKREQFGGKNGRRHRRPLPAFCIIIITPQDPTGLRSSNHCKV